MGSLGDPVINETFGAGTGIGPALAPDVTTMSYVADPCPEDGSYTIVNSANVNNGCHPTWHNVLHDHTGNPNGYMMLINASPTPDVFYIQQAHNLCPGTTYEFSAWILNLITAAAARAAPSTIEPNITFSIETTSGTVLATNNTNSITPTDIATWVQYGTYFITPPGVTDIVVRMKNNAPGGSGNDLILDDITFRACGPVLTAGVGSAVTGATLQPACAGDNVNYTLRASYVSGLNVPAFQWQLNINGAGWNDIPGQTTDILRITTSAVVGTYQYRFGAAELQNISSLTCRSYSNPVEVDVNPPPVVTIAPIQPVCEGGAIQLLASGGSTYQWYGPGLPVTSQNLVTINNLTPALAGTYTVIATSAQNCSATATAQVVVYPKLNATVSSSTAICLGQSTVLSAGGGTSYLWSPSVGLSDATVASPTASPTETTVYTVRVSNANGCFDTRRTTVGVLKKPVADAGAKKNIFEGQSVKLSGSVKGGTVSAYWTPADYLDNPNSLTPVASPVKDMTYTLNAVNDYGTDISSVFVKVYTKVVIPNTFSPNGDGKNDFWNIDALITYPNCLVTIFNRNGQQVYKSTGYGIPWDGTYNGSPLPVGTYYYIIDLDHIKPQLSGWVAIVR